MNNIIKRVWNQNRLVNIEDLTGMMFQSEIGGHTFEISGIDDTGAAVELSGTVTGVFRRPDNADIALTGSASEGVVSVTLSEDCYAVPGRFGLTIFVTSNSQKVAVYACVGTVAVSSTGNVAGDTPANVEDLIDDINAAIADLNSAIGQIPASYANVMAAIAPTYSSSALYRVGSYAWYDGALYCCTTAITTAESWTAGHWTAIALGDDVSNRIDETNERIIEGYIEKTVTDNPILLKDSATAPLRSLTADGNCDVVISGLNMISADFERVTYANRADETIVFGKGGYDYSFPSRVTVSECANNKIRLTPTSPNVITTGVGIFVKVKPGTTYILTYDVSGSGTVSLSRYSSELAYVSNIRESAQSGYAFNTETSPYVCISFRGTVQNSEVTFTNMQLAEGNTESPFVPYQAKQTVSVTADTPADVSGISTYYPITHIESESEVTITAGYYANPKSYIEEGNANLIKDIQANAFVSSYNSLDGWEEHAKAFSQLMYDVNDTEGFMFFTDTHFMAKQNEAAWKEYAHVIFAYLEQLYYASPCSFVLHGGDWLGSGEAWSSIIYKLSTLGGIFRSRFDRFALLVGNHETGNQSEGNHTTTHGTLAATLLSNVGKTYYRFDANTFHLYCFDSWVSGAIDSYAKEQIAWFANSLLTDPSPHIAIAIHILYDVGTLKALGDELTKCASAYNSRTTYSYDGNSYNFSSCTGKVAFVIAGHEHGDSTGTVNDIPYILTRNTTGYSETSFNNLPLPVDLIRVDWNTGKLTAYRAERGSEGTTREITMVT